MTQKSDQLFLLEMELDLTVADLFEEAISPAVTAGGHIVLDMTGLRFMDSTGNHVLLRGAGHASIRVSDPAWRDLGGQPGARGDKGGQPSRHLRVVPCTTGL